MKTLTHDMRYDGATAADVYAMLGTAAFREEVCAYTGFPRRTVTVDDAGSGMHVRIDQYRPADEIPGFARKFIGAEINIVQEETWTSPTAADLTVTIPGKPGEMAGTIALAEDDGGTTEHVRVEITVKIPLVSGKLEDLIASMLLKALKAENAVGRKWLANH
ncbi:MAG: DUF2505 domain-containing protein [Marmoricola sp.]